MIWDFEFILSEFYLSDIFYGLFNLICDLTLTTKNFTEKNLSFVPEDFKLFIRNHTSEVRMLKGSLGSNGIPAWRFFILNYQYFQPNFDKDAGGLKFLG